MKTLALASAAVSTLLYSWMVFLPFDAAYAEDTVELSEAEIDRVMQSEKFVGMVNRFDRHFPDDAKRIRSEFRSILSKRTDEKTIFAAMSALTRQIVETKAHHLLTAPDEDLIAVIKQDETLTKRIAHNPALCSQFVRTGAADFSLGQAKSLKLDERDIEIVLRAIHNGSTRPVTRAVAIDADFEALYQETLRVGGSDEGWRGFESADADSSETCNTALSFYRVLLAGNFQNASAVRASIVYGSRRRP